MKTYLDLGWPKPPLNVRLLEAAPWLGVELAPSEREDAVRGLRTMALRFPAGRRPLSIPSDLVGLVVTEGLLATKLQVSGYTSSVILGAGDMVCACDIEAPPGSMPEDRAVLALTPVQLAAVDHRLLRVCLRWPAVGRALMDCLIQRLRLSSLALSLHQSPRTEERLWLALWQLADRFGRVSPSGAVVNLPRVTHNLLAEVVAARRPSVTSAMKRLSDAGLVEVTGRHRWLLRRRPEEGLQMLGIHQELAVSLAGAG